MLGAAEARAAAPAVSVHPVGKLTQGSDEESEGEGDIEEVAREDHEEEAVDRSPPKSF